MWYTCYTYAVVPNRHDIAIDFKTPKFNTQFCVEIGHDYFFLFSKYQFY